jgi:hypothetical protein
MPDTDAVTTSAGTGEAPVPAAAPVAAQPGWPRRVWGALGPGLVTRGLR